MKVGIPKEISEFETRVSIVPPMVPLLTKEQHDVFVETGAGAKSSFADAQYQDAGAKIVKDTKELYRTADVIIKFQAPQKNTVLGTHEVNLIQEGAKLISSLPPRLHPEIIPMLLERKITCFGMEYVPRITKAQSMDVLSSMSTVAGYKAVLVAAHHLGKFFPLLMTAAGTIPPVTVLVLGAGVAGLQAIATAKRLGARVEAFDPRPAVKEQVESLGAKFIEMEMPEDIETSGGYAKEQSQAFLIKEQEAIAERLPKVDAVITTAQIFGKSAPILITTHMVKNMQPGSVIVDLAVADGGNCELSEPNKAVEKYGVTVFGAVNIASTLAVHASQMHSKNVTNLFKHLFKDPQGSLDFDDEITRKTCLTHNGEIVNEMVRKTLA
ncbi:MAG: Re/Si-specific NAD(P)(+) transhydrogenase subunit alpha [bacterium]